jgi:hypothetical protein
MEANVRENKKCLQTRMNTGYYDLGADVTDVCVSGLKSNPSLSASFFVFLSLSIGICSVGCRSARGSL